MSPNTYVRWFSTLRHPHRTRITSLWRRWHNAKTNMSIRGYCHNPTSQTFTPTFSFQRYIDGLVQDCSAGTPLLTLCSYGSFALKYDNVDCPEFRWIRSGALRFQQISSQTGIAVASVNLAYNYLSNLKSIWICRGHYDRPKRKTRKANKSKHKDILYLLRLAKLLQGLWHE